MCFSLLFICNAQCDAQDAEQCTVKTASVQPLFKFWSATGHPEHLILALQG